jgi:DNA repair exonuclease SbcCD ATPase subunit
MSQRRTYTINEAAALSGRHPNTIRQKIKMGLLEASVTQGKFGEEYRIAHETLVEAGLLSSSGPLGEASNSPVLDAELVEDRETPDGRAERTERPEEPPTSTALAALGELYQRHEQAMFRLGYLQGELERLKALEETAESLRRDNTARSEEVQTLKSALQEKDAEAREAERLRQEREREARETERLRRELERAQERLREMEQLRQDIDQLKGQMTAQQLEAEARKPWWQFW